MAIHAEVALLLIKSGTPCLIAISLNRSFGCSSLQKTMPGIGLFNSFSNNFIELRGIGIVDVKALFGASSVKDTQNIDLVIHLEDWDKDGTD